MKYEILDLKGKKKEETTLKPEIFGVTPHLEVLKQYLRVYTSNQRQGTASTKTRGEVSGSGKKPWAQKGTGRARVGDKRNPIWTKGGISHGPKPKSWNLDFMKNQMPLVLSSALSQKFAAKEAYIVDALEGFTGKTKDAANLFKNMELKRRILVVFPTLTAEIRKSFGNLKNVEMADAARLNAFQIIKSDAIVLAKSVIADLEKRLNKEKGREVPTHSKK